MSLISPRIQRIFLFSTALLCFAQLSSPASFGQAGLPTGVQDSKIEDDPPPKPEAPVTPATTPVAPPPKQVDDEKKSRLYKAQMHAYEAGKALKKNYYGEAQKEYRIASDFDPDNMDYMTGYANAAHQNSDWVAAATAYTRIIRKDPSRKELHKMMGDCFQQAGKYDDAVASFKLAIPHEEDKGELWRRIASIRASQNRQAEVIDAYRQGLKVAPKDGKIYEMLAALEWKNDNKAAAMVTYKNGVTNAPENGDLRAAYAYALMADSRWREAAEQYKKAALTKGKTPAIEQGYKSAMDHIAYDEQMAKIKAAQEAKKKKH